MAEYWILIAVGLVVAILAILARRAVAGKKAPTGYYGLFLGGIVWLLFGIAMEDTIFLAGGVILLLIGLAHKSEWKKNAESMGPSAKYAIALGFIIAFILAVSFFYLGSNLETKAKQFCGNENVATAKVCDGYIEVVSSLLGGGSTYYRDDGTAITCPVVGPDSMSQECRNIYEAKLNSSITCKDVCIKVTDFESCVAAGYPFMESYPRQCRANGVTYVEKISGFIECTPEKRNIAACTAINEPVCAKVNVQCIMAPCDPVNETFSNACEACANQLVEGYWEGACRE